jgi:hypothetical protein
MALTEAQILECAGHLLELLFSELRFRLPPGQPFDMERFLKKFEPCRSVCGRWPPLLSST